MNWKSVLPLVQSALHEDQPWGDVTSESLIDSQWSTELGIRVKQAGVIAGLPIAEMVFRELDPNIRWDPYYQDGDQVDPGTIIATLYGSAQALIQAERVALNFIQRMSGIATLTAQFVQEARKGSDTVQIVDTRKTTPGLRILEKYSIRMGGGHNHRHCLSDGVMIKDNHMAILAQQGKSLQDAVRQAKRSISHMVKIEIEIDTLDQLPPVLEAGADVILLDNMSCEEMKSAVAQIAGRALTEASGGITLGTVADVAASGVDMISVGALTHSAPSLDISLDFPEIITEQMV